MNDTFDRAGRHRTTMRAKVLVAALSIGGLLAVASGWMTSAVANDVTGGAATPTLVMDGYVATESPEPTGEVTIELPSADIAPTEDVLDAPVSEPVPTTTPEPTPNVALTAILECSNDSGLTGLLTLDVTGAPATITDVLALVAPSTTTPVRLDATLPAILSPQTVVWRWWLDAASEALATTEPTTLLARVDAVPGDETANAAAGDGRGGWFFVEVAPPASACPAPTPATEVDAELQPNGTPPVETAPLTPWTTPDGAGLDVPPEATKMPAEHPAVIDAVPAEATPISNEAPGEASPPPTDQSSDPLDLIVITGRSSDAGVQPGEVARYRFRVTNTADYTVSVQLVTTDSADGWTSTVFAADGLTKLPAEIQVEAGESIDVVVQVTPPLGIRPGSQNITSLELAHMTVRRRS